MPYVSNMDDEQKPDQAAPPQGGVSPTGGGTGVVRLSPSAAVPSVGGGGTSGASAGAGGAPAPVAGGQFGSLQNYLSANQGQAAPLAGKITNSVNQEYGNLDAQNNAAIANINKQVTGAPGYTPNNPDVIAAATANPVSFASDPNNVKQFQSLLNNSYSGPASAESTSDYGSRQAAINNAIATGKKNTTTTEGRENLLSQNEATPTAGVTALNSAILSQDPNALSSVENAYTPFNNLLTNLQTGAQGVNATIGKEQADAATSSSAANKAISDQINSINTAAQGNLNTANATNAGVANQYKGLLDTLGKGTNIISPEQLSALGITKEQADALQHQGILANTTQYMTGHNFGAPSATTDVDNTAFLKSYIAPTAPTINQTATPEQFQRLMSLLTLNNGQLPSGALLDPTQAAQAGTYAAPTLNGAFDYNSALANATAVQQQERADAQAQANALTAQADAEHAASKHGGIGNMLKDAISQPGKILAPLYNPAAAVDYAKQAFQGKGGPFGTGLPNAKEKAQLGIK